MTDRGLAVLETHPIQYHAPVYRMLQQRFGIPVTAIYASDFGAATYTDPEFGETFAWDTDLTSGYTSIFLSRVASGGAAFPEEVSARGLDSALRAVAPRVVLSVGYAFRFHQIGLYRTWRAGIPLVFRAETTDHAASRGRARQLARDWLLRSLYDHCSRLLYIGARSHEHFRRLGCSESKLLFAPYCVDLSAFQWDETARDRLRRTTRESLEIGDGDTVILFSGKLSSRKAPDLVLAAVKELPAPIREHTIVVFLGSGEMRAHLESFATEAPAVRVKFTGFLNQTQLSPYFHAADLLALPSLHSETWGLVVNEALHHGVPCVVSEAVGCAPDLIQPGLTGEVFSTGSAASLAAAIIRVRPLVGRPHTREACRDIAANYSVDQAAEGISRAYLEARQGISEAR